MKFIEQKTQVKYFGFDGNLLEWKLVFAVMSAAQSRRSLFAIVLLTSQWKNFLSE